MAIDHEAHKIRIKAVSDRMNHPMTYNDAGALKESGYMSKEQAQRADSEYKARRSAVEREGLELRASLKHKKK